MTAIVGFLAATLIRTMRALLWVRHIRRHHVDGTPQYILALWHAHLLFMLHAVYRRPIMTMSSSSKDGDLMVATYSHYNVEAARGSSTRGGTAAMREFLRAASKGYNLAFTPDGPKGPPRVLKEGVIYAAQATGLPIIPVAFAAKKKSYCAPGIAWSSPCHSRERSISTASRSTCPVKVTSRSGGTKWKSQ